jgi:hypothetical protein
MREDQHKGCQKKKKKKYVGHAAHVRKSVLVSTRLIEKQQENKLRFKHIFLKEVCLCALIVYSLHLSPSP